MKRLPLGFGKITGFSLVELMISIVVGLIVIGGVLGVFVSAIKSHSDNLKMTRLNQELRTVMNMMVRDIRRAGFNRNARDALDPAMSNTNPFSDPGAGTNLNIAPGNSCITFAYDYDGDGSLGLGGAVADERYGYRLDAVSMAVEMRQGGATCAVGGWVNITDENSIEIVPVGGNPALSFTVSSLTADIDGVPGGSGISVRNVEIVLSGHLKSDTSVGRTLMETVRVRADLYIPPPP